MSSLLLTDALFPPCSSGSSLPPPVPSSTRVRVARCFSITRRASSSCWTSLCVRGRSGKTGVLATAVGGGGSPLSGNAVTPNNSLYVVGDFMTKKEDLRVVKPTTTVDEALEMLVNNRITGFPVIDDNWKLVGVVSDYDLLALDSISGGREKDTDLFPEVDSSWRTFSEIQKLLSKTNGKVIRDLMTPAPMVVHEGTNLEEAARILLETKYRRLPVVDSSGNLVGILTRGNVIRAALHIKRETEQSSLPQD